MSTSFSRDHIELVIFLDATADIKFDALKFQHFLVAFVAIKTRRSCTIWWLNQEKKSSKSGKFNARKTISTTRVTKTNWLTKVFFVFVSRKIHSEEREISSLAIHSATSHGADYSNLESKNSKESSRSWTLFTPKKIEWKSNVYSLSSLV